MPDPETRDSDNALIAGLHRPGSYPHAAAEVQLLETHISWVLLAGDYAYKIKKPVNLGFLDFSTLELRHRCCLEELRLNRRFAPQLYLDCVAITGDAGHPAVCGDGPVLEYAVRMRRFPQEALASRLLAANALLPRHIEAFALALADFHGKAARSTKKSGPWGTPADLLAAALQNLDVLQRELGTPGDTAAVAALRAWTMHEHAARQDLMLERQASGEVRECHGDLHLDNIVLLDDALLPFDCIEFSAGLRWNDVLSEAAFLAMDLQYRGKSRLAWLFLNAYLEYSGEYGSIRLLPFHLVYRALVRAKIVALRAAQIDGLDARAPLLQTARSYLVLADTLAHPRQPALVITHGLSGSGKSRISSALMTQAGAVRIRSDVERKRLHGIAPQERHGATAGLYGEQATAATYHHLAGLAREILAAGYTTIVDAACLQRWQRDLLRGVARTAGVPFLNLAVSAPEAVLRARISQRQATGSDASDAELSVLEQQLQNRDVLGTDELEDVVELASGEQDAEACCRQALAALAARRAAGGKA